MGSTAYALFVFANKFNNENNATKNSLYANKRHGRTAQAAQTAADCVESQQQQRQQQHSSSDSCKKQRNLIIKHVCCTRSGQTARRTVNFLIPNCFNADPAAYSAFPYPFRRLGLLTLNTADVKNTGKRMKTTPESTICRFSSATGSIFQGISEQPESRQQFMYNS